MLVLFAYTGDTENLERYAAFNKQMGLPVTLEQVGLTEADIPALCEYAHATNEWKQETPSPSPTKNSPPPSKLPTPTATPSSSNPKPPQGSSTFVVVFYCTTIQFVLEPGSLRERVQVRFLS